MTDENKVQKLVSISCKSEYEKVTEDKTPDHYAGPGYYRWKKETLFDRLDECGTVTGEREFLFKYRDDFMVGGIKSNIKGISANLAESQKLLDSIIGEVYRLSKVIEQLQDEKFKRGNL